MSLKQTSLISNLPLHYGSSQKCLMHSVQYPHQAKSCSLPLQNLLTSRHTHKIDLLCYIVSLPLSSFFIPFCSNSLSPRHTPLSRRQVLRSIATYCATRAKVQRCVALSVLSLLVCKFTILFRNRKAFLFFFSPCSTQHQPTIPVNRELNHVIEPAYQQKRMNHKYQIARNMSFLCSKCEVFLDFLSDPCRHPCRGVSAGGVISLE